TTFAAVSPPPSILLRTERCAIFESRFDPAYPRFHRKNRNRSGRGVVPASAEAELRVGELQGGSHGPTHPLRDPAPCEPAKATLRLPTRCSIESRSTRPFVKASRRFAGCGLRSTS